MSGDEAISDQAGEIDPQRASELLRLGRSEPIRPVDALIQRIEAPDKAGWWSSAVSEAWPPPQRADVMLLQGEASVQELVALKERAKRSMRQSADEESPRRATLWYLLACAAAQAHHGARISGRPPEELNEALLDLAESAPTPWPDLLRRAAQEDG